MKSDSEGSNFGYFIWGRDINHFYSVGGRGLYEYRGGKWINRLYVNSMNSIYGSDLNNIFMGGYRNKIYHFNGENWYQYIELEDENKSIEGVWCNSNNVFLIMREISKTYILRGKRKK